MNKSTEYMLGEGSDKEFQVNNVVSYRIGEQSGTTTMRGQIEYAFL